MRKTALAEYLARTCKEKGISLRSLSVKAGLSPGTVHSIIYRQYEPSLYSLNQLADYLGVKRQYLWKLAGLIGDKDLADAGQSGDPRMNYYCEKVDTLPEPVREMVIRIIGDIITTYVNSPVSYSPPRLLEVED